MGPTGERCTVSVSETSVVGGAESVVTSGAPARAEREGGGDEGCREDEGGAAQSHPRQEAGGMFVPRSQLMDASASATVHSPNWGWWKL